MFKPKQTSRRAKPASRKTHGVKSRGASLAQCVPQSLRRVTVRVLPKHSFAAPPRGLFCAGFTSFPCALGAGAVSRHKIEGDLASPVGRFRLIEGFFRPTGARPAAPWLLRPIKATDGWCDDPQSANYNRLLTLPSRDNCEKLWRNDGLYDLVIVLDYNLWPRRKGKGSAIFLHCARPDFAPTAGCIGLRPADLRKLLLRLAKKAVVIVG
jgi:L,D-peptidoglycan transpeptidase YkuD (ErfK/YbiS/YcfS/YnhG family)